MSVIKTCNNVSVLFESTDDFNASGVVYLLVFPNEKVYVGKTKNRLWDRVMCHCSDAITKESRFSVNKAIRFFHSFKVYILYKAPKEYDEETVKNKLKSEENSFIAMFGSDRSCYGYNQYAGTKIDPITRKIMQKNRNTELTYIKTIKHPGKSRTKRLIIDNKNNVFTTAGKAAVYHGLSVQTVYARTDNQYSQNNFSIYFTSISIDTDLSNMIVNPLKKEANNE